MSDIELEIRKGNLAVKIRGNTKNEVLSKCDEAFAILNEAYSKLEGKGVVTKEISAPTVTEAPVITAPKSCREAITKLMTTDWGRKPRTLSDIIDAMQMSAVYYSKPRVATELIRMTRLGILRRLKTEAGYAYVLAKPL